MLVDLIGRYLAPDMQEQLPLIKLSHDPPRLIIGAPRILKSSERLCDMWWKYKFTNKLIWLYHMMLRRNVDYFLLGMMIRKPVELFIVTRNCWVLTVTRMRKFTPF